MLIPDTIIGEGHVWDAHGLRVLCLGTFTPDPASRVLVVFRLDEDVSAPIHVLLYDSASGDAVTPFWFATQSTLG